MYTTTVKNFIFYLFTISYFIQNLMKYYCLYLRSYKTRRVQDFVSMRSRFHFCEVYKYFYQVTHNSLTKYLFMEHWSLLMSKHKNIRFYWNYRLVLLLFNQLDKQWQTYIASHQPYSFSYHLDTGPNISTCMISSLKIL